jgi:acetyl esterase
VRYAIGGDSAGANLAVSSTICLRDAGEALPAALLLNYGAFDGTPRPSFARYGDGDRYMLTGPEMDAFWQDYLGPAPVADSLARPLLADLGNLPPTWLCVAQCDVLLDENVEMARRLTEAGADVQLRIYDGATHSFLEAVAISGIARRAIAEAAEWLTTILVRK